MGVFTESGYTWANGKHARILHAGNMFAVKSITASADSGSTADLVNNDLTVDRWRPFSNQVAEPSDFNGADWTATNVTVGSDGQTITETTASGVHEVQQAFTFTATEWVVSFKVERQTIPEVRIIANDGTTSYTCFFDLRDGTVGSTLNGAVGKIIDLGDGIFECLIYFTPAAGTGTIRLRHSDGTETDSYNGSTDNTIKILRATAHVSAATLDLDLFTAQGGTCFAIAAHNIWTGGGRLTFLHDSNGDTTYTSIGTATPTDDSPVMFFFSSISSAAWRVQVDRSVLPEIGIVRVGDPLVFERARYAGASPARMNRATDVIGNISRSGELLGRSNKKTILRESAQWQNLTYDWVRANLDGRNGVIQSLETKAAFMAWRPELVTEDVSYLMRATTTPPAAQGVRDLWSFGLEAEVYAYE